MNIATKITCYAAVASFLLTQTALGQSLADIEAAAKKEGKLTVIALPHDWCGYGEVIKGFKTKYPEIAVNELNPDAGSADELEAVRANKDNKGPQAPDVLDIGFSFGPQAKSEGLLQPYKVSTWNEIPDNVKDAEGYWYGDYYGVLAFGTNKDLIKNAPQDWADLLKPEYAKSVSLSGNPLSGNQPLLGVMSAGIAMGGKPGVESAQKGMEFIAQLNKAGNFVPVEGKAGNIAQGQTPIVVAWDYNLMAWRDSLAGNPDMDIVVPKSGVVAGVYVQAISAYAPNPNAAKLWMEYLYSDEGQTLWLKGYCHPIRFNSMAAAGKFPKEMLDKLPPAAAYEKAIFPTLDEQSAHKTTVSEGWANAVGVTVQ
jgi:putative spermidine/putrescine transport system substrate-binding protein